MRVLLAFSSFFAWFLVLQEIAIPFEKFGIFTVLVFKMLRKDVTVWLLLFTPICLGFTTALKVPTAVKVRRRLFSPRA